MSNKYKCSNGESVSQSAIDARRSKAYKEYYGGEAHPSCKGCGNRAEGTAHIVPQKICKSEGITEYCWLTINFLPACHKCNNIIENYKSEEFKKLMCYDRVLEVTQKILPSRYLKMVE